MIERAFVDTETTGISQRARVVEIGYVLEGGQDREVEFWLPYSPYDVEVGAHAVNDLGPGGRTPSSLRLPPAAAVSVLQEDWRQRELVFNNPAFDIWMIRKLFDQVRGAEPTWHYHPVDVQMLLKGIFALPTNAKGDEWAAGIEPEPEVHSALEGARLVKRQFAAYERLRQERTS